MPPQLFYTFPATGQVGVQQAVSYDGTKYPVEVDVTYNPGLGGFTHVLTGPGDTVPVTPPPGCTSVTLVDTTGGSQAFTLPVE